MGSIYFGNTVEAWLFRAGLAVAIYLTLYLVKRVAVTRLATLAERTDTDFDDALVDVVRNTKKLFLVALSLYFAIRGLYVNPALIGPIEKTLQLSFLFQIGLWASGLVSFLVKRSLEKRDQASDRIGVAAVNAIGVAIKVVSWIVVVLFAIQNVFNKPVTALVTSLGVGGIAIALAVQNILGDLLAAVAIVFDRPFDVGDTIQVDQMVGKVEQIGLKTTRLRSVSGEQLIMGNGELLKSRLRNYKRMYERRAVLQLDLEYSTDAAVVERVPGLLRQIIEAQTGVRFERSHFSGFMESALRIETVYFVLDPDYARFMDVQQSINLAILRRFSDEKIAFAFPTRTVELKAPDGLFTSAPGSSLHPPQSTAR